MEPILAPHVLYGVCRNTSVYTNAFSKCMYKATCDGLFVVLLLTLPSSVGGGPICYISCIAAVGGTAIFGTAVILPALGFTSTGIAAGSWAATWMSSYGGAVPPGSMFATFQSAGVTGATTDMMVAVTGSASSLCAAICVPLP